MSVTDFIPDREADLVAWSNNYAAVLLADPVAVGITAIEATAFDGLNTLWIDSYAVANNGLTRSPANIAAKNIAKDNMVASARDLAATIQAFAGITDPLLIQLGLTVRDTEPTPVPIPTVPPGIEIMSSIGTNVKIRLRDTENPDSRAKPFGVAGASVLTAFGSAPPDLSDTAAWTWQGNSTKNITTLQFPGVVSGTTVWITSMWFNTRGLTGNPTQPVSVQIPGQLAQAA